jgi:hydrogenase 3 maturation protease
MNLLSEIKSVISDSCCIVGMGNLVKSDDAVGLYIIESVKKAVKNDHMIFNVEDVIEAFVYKIAELDCMNIVIIDAVKAGAETGSIIFGKLDDEFEELEGTLSTHKLALKMSGRIFTEYKKETYLLGVVVNNIDFGIELSPEVRESADVLINIITDVLNSGKGVCK